MDFHELFLKEEKCFKEALDTVKKLPLLEGIELSYIDNWDEVNGCVGFPIRFNVEYKIEGRAVVFASVYNGNDRIKFESIEIVSIDTQPGYRLKGYGESLLKQIELIAQELDLYVYGVFMPEAKGFYEACDYKIKGNKFIKDFRSNEK
jgi:GNAT superfamily N-acetyltransferase